MTRRPLPFQADPPLVAALHLPDPALDPSRSMAWLEDYALTNARVFAEAGFPALMLQDQTREPGDATAETIAVTAALGRSIKRAFPAMALGIIVQAHDAVAPLAIAKASGADFVRLKVFVGAAMTAEGVRQALSPRARAYRQEIGAGEIAIFADVFDRTSLPLVNMSPERAALWAQSMGADALVLTGATFADSLDRISKARDAGVTRPILLGGSATLENIAVALATADGAIVSTALMRKNLGPDELIRWDADLTKRFVDAARKGATR